MFFQQTALSTSLQHQMLAKSQHRHVRIHTLHGFVCECRTHIHACISCLRACTLELVYGHACICVWHTSMYIHIHIHMNVHYMHVFLVCVHAHVSLHTDRHACVCDIHLCIYTYMHASEHISKLTN